MPRLENPNHELFAHNVAKGKTYRESYRRAGYATIKGETTDSAASRLLRHVKVRARVAELQGLAAKRTMVTIEKLTEELEDARLLAMKDDKGAAAAVSAIMAKAKLHGLDINRLSGADGGPLQVIISSEDAKVL